MLISEIPKILADIFYPEEPGDEWLIGPDILRQDAEDLYRVAIISALGNGTLKADPEGENISKSDVQEWLDLTGIPIKLGADVD